jgi:hypothetical protein
MSFLNRKNILSEGFFDSLKKFITRPKLSKEEKKLMKDPKFKKAFHEYESAAKKAYETGEKLLKKYGIPPIKY